MTEEVEVMIHAIDMGMIVQVALNESLDRSAEMETFVDSRALFKMITKDSNTVERLLRVDIFVLRESY